MRILPALLALAISTIGLPAIAQTAPEAEASPAATTPIPAPPAEPQPMTPDMLAAESGLGVDTTVLTEQQLNATNSGNAVIAGAGIHTGDVAFSSTALSGFSGVGNFVINTGNNSNLQGAINISIVTTNVGPMQ